MELKYDIVVIGGGPAGMGRCQSGFCSPRVTEILSRELGIPMTDVRKNGGCSYILTGKTR